MRLTAGTLTGLATLSSTVGLPPSMAADHGDAPFASVKRSGDLNDLYVFLDPNDNSRVVVILTPWGSPCPARPSISRCSMMSWCSSSSSTRTSMPPRTRGSRSVSRGNARPAPPPRRPPSPCRTAGSSTALTTSSNLTDAPPAPTITNGPRGIHFFAGSADDPFFFDIPGFNRFVASVLAGAADPALLQRGRDSFAGLQHPGDRVFLPGELLREAAKQQARRERCRNQPVRHRRTPATDRPCRNPRSHVAFVPLDLDDLQNRSSTVENSEEDPDCHRRDPPGARDQPGRYRPPGWIGRHERGFRARRHHHSNIGRGGRQ